ncbi:hypothetical protein MCELANE86_00470 [Candidatus Nanopelagicaceae bacterium]
MNKEIWVETYQPRTNPDGTFKHFDVVEDLDFISSIEDEYVWTEIWDFDSERPWLVSGCVLDENGGLSWYVCDKAWEGDQILVEWDED